MSSASRTSKTIKNSTVALGIYMLNLILQFYSRKVFLDYLGTEILGLNTTANNLLQFLNLAELGISSAVGFTLYKPLHDNDRETINEIVTLQGRLYSRIAVIVIIGAVISMLFFPLIFAKIKLPLWYAYASYCVLLFSALLGYFINYKQIVLSASQQEYKIQYSYKLIVLVKVAAQMLAVYHFENGYIWWLIFEVVFTIIGSVTLNIVIRRSFPYLKKVKSSYKELRTKYSEFVVKIKQLFVHKIASFVLSQLSPIILYAYSSLTMVALYGNYNIIIIGLQSLVTSFFNGMNAGIGDLVAEGDADKITKVFSELFSIRFILAICICICSYCAVPSFVALWIGEEYLLSDTTLILLLSILYIRNFRLTVESFTNAYGLYADVYAAILEAAINIGLSILLGYFYELNGILAGVLISLIIIVVIWKPYYLFTRKMPQSVLWYVKLYAKHILIAVPTLALSIFLINHFNLNQASNWSEFIIKIILIGLIVFTPLSLAIIMTNKSLALRLRRMVIKH